MLECPKMISQMLERTLAKKRVIEMANYGTKNTCC